MESTCVHTSLRISNQKDRYTYVKAMRRCYYLCSEEVSGNSLATMLSEISKLKRQVPKTFVRRLEIFSDTRRHYMLGIDQTLDILASISRRFVTGNSHPDTKFINNILGGKHEV